MIKYKEFKYPFDLIQYCSDNGIYKKDIIQITHTEVVCGYTTHNTYTLFYER